MATKILFEANDGTHGVELWVTDGTAAGTALVADISPGKGNSNPRNVTALGNGKAVFSATDATHGYELWVTDGTSAGTTLVDDIRPGLSSSSPGNFIALGNGKALFTATDATHGYELWVTDGTSAGTTLVDDIRPGLSSSSPGNFIALGNGKALFSANDGTHGYELWVTDGTAAGTALVDDIASGASSSFPEEITALGNGKELFRAVDLTHGFELWVTDGTAAGTALVDDINPGTPGRSSNPRYITTLGNGKALFSANDGTHGYELWVTDGTAAGTAPVINPGSGGSYPKEITALGNGKAVFSATDATHGAELWVTDGTAAGTALVADINPGTGNSNPRYITALGNGKAVFSATDATHGYELWVTDGTAAGTALVVNPGSGPKGITALGNGKAMFSASDGTDGAELWVTDGTAAGTALVDDINYGPSGSNPSGFTVLTPVCFCRGTLILTERGEVAVEDLMVGERVVTLSGEVKPIVWIGMGRELVTRSNRLARPIIVHEGALEDNVPSRDLHLTHGHALYFDGVLIPVENLVNHRSIRWDESTRVVEYYHIELEDHDVLFAEGAPAESYHDAGNRAFFQNGRSGSQAGLPKPTVAPVLHCGQVAESVWSRLFDRAGGRIETETTDDPDLHLRIDGARLDPAATDAGVFTFALDRPPAERLCLCSRAGVPSLLGRGGDHRPLGVAIKQIILDQFGIPTCFDYDLPQFREGGCYPPENGFCWTDGEFELPARFFVGLKGRCTLTVRLLRHEMRYPIRMGSASRDLAA